MLTPEYLKPVVFNTLPRIFSPDKNARVAIIIPYRDRAEHLSHFISHFDHLSQSCGLHNFEIFVIEQIVPGKFNRGLLCNSGFFIASRTRAFDRYIFHDVDSYPSATIFRQFFAFPGLNIHYASPDLGYKYTYHWFFGGITAFCAADFAVVNGFPNSFFGWGGEDDALLWRVEETEVAVYRPSIGKFSLVKHAPPTSGEKNSQKRRCVLNDRTHWREDGLAQLASPELGVLYRRLTAPTDMVPSPPPETPLAHFRRAKDARKIHFYGISWPGKQIQTGGGRTAAAITSKHGYGAAHLPRNQEPGQYVAYIREFMETYRRPLEARTGVEMKEKLPRIALLFIVQDKLPLINIWSAWLDAVPSSNFDVFIHAKYPTILQATLGTHPFSSRIINTRHSPSGARWGSIELTQTMHFLLHTALTRAKRATHFVFLSESCIPIVHPAVALARSAELGAHSQFRLERIDECKDKKYAVPRQFEALAHEIPSECALKSDQWVMLSRTHAHSIVDFIAKISAEVPVWYLIASIVKASDEMFVPSMLCLAIDSSIDAEVDTRRITYTEHEIGAPHPRVFSKITQSLINTAREQGACFLRKITAPKSETATEQLFKDWYNTVMV